MANFIGGPVLRATSAYNPIYWYADSAEKTREQFRYTLKVEEFIPAGATHSLLADLKLLPRYEDGFMEVNLNKVLQSPLGFAPDAWWDATNLTNTQIWYPAQKAGYEYRLTLGEEYLYTWDWVFWATSINGKLTLVSNVSDAPTYQIGDIINVTGVTEEFAYTSITNDAGFAQFNFAAPHTFQNGDTVNVRQDSPVSFLTYSIPSTVTSFTTNSITVNIPFAGTPYQAQTGKAYRNFRADAFHQVSDIVISPPFFFLELDFTNFNGTAGVTGGSSTYSDNRTVSSTSTLSGGAVFNGAIKHDEWPTFPFQDYWGISPFPVPNQKFLTAVPEGHCVRPENDIFLNLFTRGATAFERLRLTTYDQNGSSTGSYWYENDYVGYSDQTTTAFRLGERMNNSPVQVLTNVEFQDASTWQITNVLGATAQISSGVLNYLDNTGTGDGSAYVVQPDVLVPGQEYTVTMQVNNNNFAQVLVGDENDTYQILNNQNGTFTTIFTATGNDFWIEINSAGGVTQGVDIQWVKAKTIFFDAITCDDSTFDITVTREAIVDVVTNGSFTTTDDWSITNQLGGTASIAAGVLNYLDNTGTGDGSAYVVQAGILEAGKFYTVTITSTNTNFVQVFVGDENDTYQIVNNANGTFTTTFTATGTDFWIEINSAGGVTQGVDLDNVIVQTLVDETLTETKSFKICCDCDGRYENIELLFAERMGSIIPWNFNLNNRRRVNIKRETYKHNIGGLRPFINRYAYATGEHADMSYHVGLSEEWDINTDWMDEASSLYFEELVTSAKVWIKAGASQFRAVHIKDRVHDIKMKNNEKMIQYRVTIIFSSNDNVQEG